MIVLTGALGAGAMFLITGGAGRLLGMDRVYRSVRAPADRRVRGVLLAACAVAVAAALWSVLLGTDVAAVGAGAGLVVVGAHRWLAARHRASVTSSAVPDACAVLAASLAAGAMPADALEIAAASAPPALASVLAEAASAERLGAPCSSALLRAPDECRGLHAVGVCWDVCVASGAALAASISGVAEVLAADFEAQELVAGELAGVWLSAWVMAGLPAVGILLGAALGADPIGFLGGTTIGRGCLAAAVALDVLGLLWVRRLGDRAAR